MNRKKKIVFSAVLGLVILLIGGLIWGGNYLVTFAIARSTGLKNIAPESTLSDEATQAIIQNWQQQAQQAKAWMAQSTVETVQVQSADGLKLIGDPSLGHRRTWLPQQSRFHVRRGFLLWLEGLERHAA